MAYINIDGSYYFSDCAKDGSDVIKDFNKKKIQSGQHLNLKIEDLYDIPVYTTKKQSIMQKLSNNMKRMLIPNHQALYKAGYLNGDLDITEDGRIALTDLLLEKYETEMVEKAKAHIEELEKENKG